MTLSSIAAFAYLCYVFADFNANFDSGFGSQICLFRWGSGALCVQCTVVHGTTRLSFSDDISQPFSRIHKTDRQTNRPRYVTFVAIAVDTSAFSNAYAVC